MFTLSSPLGMTGVERRLPPGCTYAHAFRAFHAIAGSPDTTWRRFVVSSPRAPAQAVKRPFYVVRDPATDARWEVSFDGRGLTCSCDGPLLWCAHRHALWTAVVEGQC